MDSHDDSAAMRNSIGEIRRGIAVLRASTRPWDNAQFFYRYWRCSPLGSSEVRLQAGDIPNARIEVDDLLESALSPLILNLQALPGR